MKTQKIVFFDLDHTVFDPIAKTVPQSTKEAFARLAKRGDVLIALATGRALYMLDVAAPLLPYIDTYVTINGQVITHQGKTIHDAPLDSETVREVERVFKQHDLTYGMIGKHNQAVNRLDDFARNEFAGASMPLPPIDPGFSSHADVYQLWAFADKATFARVKADLEGYNVVPWLSDGFDVVPRDQSKKDGIAKVLDHLNIPLNNAYAFGDGENDIEMLAYVPHSVAMGNAKPHVKDTATHVTGRFNEDGVYRALVKLGLIKE